MPEQRNWHLNKYRKVPSFDSYEDTMIYICNNKYYEWNNQVFYAYTKEPLSLPINKLYLKSSRSSVENYCRSLNIGLEKNRFMDP